LAVLDFINLLASTRYFQNMSCDGDYILILYILAYTHGHHRFIIRRFIGDLAFGVIEDIDSSHTTPHGCIEAVDLQVCM